MSRVENIPTNDPYGILCIVKAWFTRWVRQEQDFTLCKVAKFVRVGNNFVSITYISINLIFFILF